MSSDGNQTDSHRSFGVSNVARMGWIPLPVCYRDICTRGSTSGIIILQGGCLTASTPATAGTQADRLTTQRLGVRLETQRKPKSAEKSYMDLSHWRLDGPLSSTGHRRFRMCLTSGVKRLNTSQTLTQNLTAASTNTTGSGLLIKNYIIKISF